MDRADEWSVETEVRVPVITRSQEWLSRADRVLRRSPKGRVSGSEDFVRPTWLAVRGRMSGM
jgi:hypothetical protein